LVQINNTILPKCDEKFAGTVIVFKKYDQFIFV